MRNRNRNGFLIFLCIVFGGILIFMIYTERQKEKAQQALYEELAAQARPYEKEVSSLRLELSEMEKDVAYTSDHAKLMVGFDLSDISDVAQANDLAAEYGFAPVGIFECTGDYAELLSLINSAVGAGWEIMLTASSFSEEINETVISVLSYLETIGAEESGVFLLRNGSYNSTNIEMLSDDGFIGYTVYNTTVPADGQDGNGMVYFEYYYVSAETTAVASKLSYLRSELSSMIVVIDMAAVNSGEISEIWLADLMDSLQTYDGYDDCGYATVADVVAELSKINEIEAENEVAYEQAREEMQEQINELEEMISDIWSNYSY